MIQFSWYDIISPAVLRIDTVFGSQVRSYVWLSVQHINQRLSYSIDYPGIRLNTLLLQCVKNDKSLHRNKSRHVMLNLKYELELQKAIMRRK